MSGGPSNAGTAMPSGMPASRVSGGAAAGVMVGLLGLAYLLAYYDRLITVVVSQAIKLDFGISDSQLSVINGASFMIVYSVGSLGAGVLIDRLVRKNILIAVLVLWSTATMVCGFATSYEQLALARAAVGLGECAITPLALSMISDSYRPNSRPLMMAVFYAGGMVGILGSFLLGGYVAQIWGWQWAFFIAGPPGYVLAVIVWVFCKEPQREQAMAEGDTGFGAVIRGIGRAVGQFGRNPPLFFLILGGAISSFANIGMMQWLPLHFMRGFNMNPSEIGLLFGPASACGMAGGLLLGGWLGNRMVSVSVPRLIWFATIAIVAMPPMYFVVLISTSQSTALALTFLATATSVLWSPAYTSAAQTICDPMLRGMTAALAGFGATVTGGAACTYFVGQLSDHLAVTMGAAEGLRWALIVSLLFLICGAVSMAWAAVLQRRREAAMTPR